MVTAIVGVTIAAVVIGGIVGATAWRSASKSGDSTAEGGGVLLVQRSTGGGVEVAATLATTDQLKDVDPSNAAGVDLTNEVAFILIFDTHQGDLRSFDFKTASRLLRATGGEESALRWVLMKNDAHHLEGMLVFARDTDSRMTLAIRGLSGVAERLFNFPGQN